MDEKPNIAFYITLFVVGALSVLPFSQTFEVASINDEGIVAVGALRLWLGDAVYTDFTTHFAPGIYYLNLLLFYVFGPTMTAVRLLMALMTGGLGLCVYLLAKACLPSRYALVPYGLFLCAGVTQWPILSYHWGGVLSFLIGTIALIHWCQTPTRLTAALCGATFAFSCWMLQSEAAALLLLTGLVTLDRRKEMTRLDFGYWLCGMFCASALLWAPILLRASVSDIWTQNVKWAIFHNAEPGRSPYDIGNITSRWNIFFQQLSKASWSGPVIAWVIQTLSYLVVWSCNYLLFYPVLLAAIIAGWKFKEDRTFRILLYAQIATVLAWQSRQTLLYLNFLTPVFFVLLVYLLYKARRVGLVLLGTTALCYLSAYIFWCSETSQFKYPIFTVRGTLFSSQPTEANSWNQLLRTTADLSPEGTEAFCYPYAMGFYYLSGVRPVSRFHHIIPIFAPDEALPSLVTELQESKPEFIYCFPWSQDTLNAVPNVEKENFWSLVKEYDQQILKNYEPTADFGIAQIYKRKNEL